MRRAGVSIASNIAEGYERNSDKDFIRFLQIAKGSLSELRTQLDIAYSIEYIEEDIFEKLDDKCRKVSSMITKLIMTRKE